MMLSVVPMIVVVQPVVVHMCRYAMLRTTRSNVTYAYIIRMLRPSTRKLQILIQALIQGKVKLLEYTKI